MCKNGKILSNFKGKAVVKLVTCITSVNSGFYRSNIQETKSVLSGCFGFF